MNVFSVRDWYAEVMAEDGVTLAMFEALEKHVY